MHDPRSDAVGELLRVRRHRDQVALARAADVDVAVHPAVAGGQWHPGVVDPGREPGAGPGARAAGVAAASRDRAGRGQHGHQTGLDRPRLDLHLLSLLVGSAACCGRSVVG